MLQLFLDSLNTNYHKFFLSFLFVDKRLQLTYLTRELIFYLLLLFSEV